MSAMTPPFDVTPVRPPARRGNSSIRIRRHHEPWPPIDRDPADLALVAARILRVSARLQSRMRRAARKEHVELDVLSLLLLFAETRRSLRVVDIAELLGMDKGTASRLASRADAAGLIDKRAVAIDHRLVACTLSVAGCDAATASLAWLHPHAAAVLRHGDHEWSRAVQTLLEPSTRPQGSNQQLGWRAAIRAGLRTDE
jgi:DNA-binding MarR family transcriptional regulator